jgi:hypothetical protein
MLFLLTILAAASGTSPSVVRVPEAAAKPTQSCLAPGITFAQQTAKAHGLRRLGDEPPASQYLAVDRQVGGCPAPAVVRTGIGR